MPGTVQDLSRKLLNAIDSEGNVTNMSIVLEVVEALEGITITADDIRTNCLGRNINQLRRKLSDSHKSLAKRLKKLVKTWQQLIQSQTPNGLTAPSLGVTGNNSGGTNRTEQHLQQQPNIVESRRRSVSSSREGTPSQPSSGELLAGKSGVPPSHKNASRTPTPTPSPSPHPPSSALPTLPTQNPPAPVSAPPSQPPVIPRPTKAQDFARNRIRYMQMFSAVKKTSVAQATLQSQQPLAEDQPQPPQLAGIVSSSQSLPEQQTSSPSVSNSLNSATKSSSSVSQSEPLSAVNLVSNVGHLLNSSLNPTSSIATTSTSQSAANVKLTNAHPRATLSQIVTNSYSQDLASTGISSSHVPSPTPSSQTSIAHKIGVKCSRDKNSHNMTSPPESLVVQIPRNLVRVVSLPSNESSESGEVRELHEVGLEPSLAENDLSLIVKIDISLLLRGKCDFHSPLPYGDVDSRPNRTEMLENDRKHLPVSDLMVPLNSQHSKCHKVTEYDEPMETEMSPLFGRREIPFTGRHLIPSGGSPGLDGCLGNDGYWYAWTDTIPGHDEAVTVLPYIYIDDESNDGIDVQ